MPFEGVAAFIEQTTDKRLLGRASGKYVVESTSGMQQQTNDARGRRGFATGKQSLKFKIDENLPRECAPILRGGFEADTDSDEKLSGASDSVLALGEVPKNYQRTLRLVVQPTFFVASHHRDLFAYSLGDDLTVEGVRVQAR